MNWVGYGVNTKYGNLEACGRVILKYMLVEYNMHVWTGWQGAKRDHEYGDEISVYRKAGRFLTDFRFFLPHPYWNTYNDLSSFCRILQSEKFLSIIIIIMSGQLSRTTDLRDKFFYNNWYLTFPYTLWLSLILYTRNCSIQPSRFNFRVASNLFMTLSSKQ
jgi:hypothetical protein